MDEILKYFPKLSELQKQLLQLYVDRLLWWNTRINLISRQDTEHIVQRHLLHSLVIAKCFQFPKGSRILDLGTGGGLPGIPLAIFFPECTFTLIDGTGKKIKAVQAMIEDLGLKNATANYVRAEDFKGEFDFVVTRAVASLKELWSWAKPLIKAEAPSTWLGTGEAKVRRTLEVESRETLGAKEIHALHFGEGGVEWSRGLIVLKGGDLKAEMEELEENGKAGKAGKIQVLPVHDFFQVPYFLEKFIVFIPVSRSPGPELVEGPD